MDLDTRENNCHAKGLMKAMDRDASGVSFAFFTLRENDVLPFAQPVNVAVTGRKSGSPVAVPLSIVLRFQLY